MAKPKGTGKKAKATAKNPSVEDVREVLYEMFLGGREVGGSELLPPEYQANLKHIVAGELDVDKRTRLMFESLFLAHNFQYLTHQADLNASRVNAAHSTQIQNAVAGWGGVSARSMWRDRITNPDEVAQLTETNRAGQAMQLDALAALVVTKLAATQAD